MAPIFRFLTAAAVVLMNLIYAAATIMQEVDTHGDIVDAVGSGGDSSTTLTKPFSVQALLGFLAPVKALDLNSARSLLEPAAATPDDPVALARATVSPSGVPLMHYLMGLLPRLENNGAARASLATVIARLAAVGADVNAEHPNARDPSLLYKVVFMRELDLAQAFLASGAREQPQRDPDSVLGKLASVPCDLVPMAKLLLHADAFLADPKYASQERFQGAAGKASFLGSASRGAGAKPIPRSDYLFNASSTYRSLVGQLGSRSSGDDDRLSEMKSADGVEGGVNVAQPNPPSLGPDGLPLAALVNSLGEGSAAVLFAWLRAAPTKGKALSRLADAVGRMDDSLGDKRNPLHALAAAGSAAPVDALATFLEERAAAPTAGAQGDFEDLPAKDSTESTTTAAAASSTEDPSDSSQSAEAGAASAEKKRIAAEKRAALKVRTRSAVASALASTDSRGHTPIDVAALRWGARATFAVTATEVEESKASSASSGSSSSSSSSSSLKEEIALDKAPSPLVQFTSPVEVALQRLAVAAGLEPGDVGHSMSPNLVPSALRATDNGSKVRGSSSSGVSGDDSDSSGSGSGGSGSGSSSGGWDLTRWPPLASEARTSLPGKCDVLELNWADEWAAAEATARAANAATGAAAGGRAGENSAGGISASAVFGHRFLRDFVHRGQPVVLRGAAPRSAQEAFVKEKFLARYGQFPVSVGAIPYASSFGSSQRVATLGDVANATSSAVSVSATLTPEEEEAAMPDATSHDSSNRNIDRNQHRGHERAAAEYAFTTPPDGPSGWAHLVAEDAPPPPWLQWVLAQFPHAGYETQFYLGPAGSGAPAHFHGHAVNVLAHGSKRWSLWPPQHALYSKEPAADRWRRLHGNQTSTFTKGVHEPEVVLEPLECTQEAGDMLFVPTLWGHATLNERQAIGTAYELSLEPFCME